MREPPTAYRNIRFVKRPMEKRDLLCKQMINTVHLYIILYSRKKLARLIKNNKQ